MAYRPKLGHAHPLVVLSASDSVLVMVVFGFLRGEKKSIAQLALKLKI